MGVSSVIFANTRAYSALNFMLTAERYQRLLDCEDATELKKCLTEFGFEGESTDEMFSRALDGIYAYLEDGSPVETVRQALLKKNDYHNAKVMAKCKYVRREITADLLYPYGNIDVVKFKEYVLNDDYSQLPVPMSEALGKIDLRFSQGERNGKLIDCLLNKAMYEDIFKTLGVRYGEMKEVFRAEVDFSNISAALRSRKNGLPTSALEEEFITGGTLSFEQVALLLDCSDEQAKNAFAFSEYKRFILSALEELQGDALTDYERQTDDYVIGLLRKYKGNNDHYMLFYGYVLAKLYELKNVRIICGGVKAKTPKEKIKAKLRESYV